MWKLAFSSTIPESAVSQYAKTLDGLDVTHPETYEMLATGADLKLKDAPDPPEVLECLRPYILLNELERDAPSAVSNETTAAIVDHAAECLPVLRAALRQWARQTAEVSTEAACMIVAI